MRTEDLGRVGIWAPYTQVTANTASELEQLGYGTLWLGASPGAALEMVEPLLDATERLFVATSIVNIWAAAPEPVAESFHRLEEKYPGRFLLGIGAGHPEATSNYRKPYEALVDYLDRLDERGVPVERRALAALGPRVLELARTRTAGALPYLITPQYTRDARKLIGPDTLLVAEQKIVLDSEPESAREIGRTRVGTYLRLSNYVANLKRIGFSEEDVQFPGSDHLIDALAVHGDVAAISARLRAHLTAGADHIAIQVLARDNDILPAARALAGHV